MDIDSGSKAPDMSGWSDAKKAKYAEVKAKGGTWQSDKAYEASKPAFTAKPGNSPKPQMGMR